MLRPVTKQVYTAKDVDDLRAQVQGRGDALPQNEPPGWFGMIGFWFCESLDDRTLVSNVDWDDFFDAPQTYARRTHCQITAGGSFKLQMSDANTRDTRCRIAFWNDGPSYTRDVTIEADTFGVGGELQVKVNGEYTRYTSAPQDLVWKFRNGINEVQITIAEGVSRLELIGTLWQPPYGRFEWVDWNSGWDR